MTIIEGTVEGRKNKILLNIRDRHPGKTIETYLQDEKVLGVDAVVSIVTPMGTIKGNEYLQVVMTLCIIKEGKPTLNREEAK